MSTITPTAPPLVPGQRLTREEFLRRWEQMPDLKRAELIAGIVYMPSPLSRTHGRFEVLANIWVGNYAAFTPGCEAASQATWLMLEDAPQPDVDLRILPSHGGQSSESGKYLTGAPELIVEVSVSSTAYDLSSKLELYRSAGVREYITVLPEKSEIIWRLLADNRYIVIPPDPDGFYRSRVFPGLWLDPQALLALDGRRVLEVVQQGLQSPEYRKFTEQLTQRKESQP